MKCLTWFLCLLAASVIWTILDINGYARFIETLAVYSFFIFIADQICKRIDAKAEQEKRNALIEQNRKETEALRLAASTPVRPIEYTAEEREKLKENTYSSLKTWIKREEEPVPIQEEKPSKGPSFCHVCGHPIDRKTGRCTGCGKQYHRFRQILKKCRLSPFAIVLLTISIITIVGLSIMTTHLNSLNSQVSYLKNQVSKLDNTIDTKEKELAAYKERFKSDVEKWQLPILPGLPAAERLDAILARSEANTPVFATDGGSKYHSEITCSHLTNRNPRLLTQTEAKKAGYTKCLKCW